MPSRVLIVTKSDDNSCIESVSAALAARGLQAFRFDSDRFPGEVRLVARQDDQADEVSLEDQAAGARVALADLVAVWYRRLDVAARLPATLAPKLRPAAVLESRTVVQGLLAAIPAFRLDPPEHVRLASHKALQLRVAREVGLAVPRTLTTNDPAAVHAFWRACDGRVVTKVLSSFAVHDEAGREQVMFTTRLHEADLDALGNSLDLCPMTFQEEVPKALELRATVVGQRVFCAAVDAAVLAGAEVDWRRRGAELCAAWLPHRLPDDVAARLLRLARYFGLNYGAADIIVRPDGTHVFLEINPGGEFFWLEPALPISAALAAVLAGEGRAG